MSNDILRQKVIDKLVSDEITEEKAADMTLRAEEYFKWATNIKVVPDSAFYLWIDMSKSLLDMNSLGNSDGVKSVKEGDTTVEYANAKDSYSILSRFSQSLNPYKKVKMG